MLLLLFRLKLQWNHHCYIYEFNPILIEALVKVNNFHWVIFYISLQILRRSRMQKKIGDWNDQMKCIAIYFKITLKLLLLN